MNEIKYILAAVLLIGGAARAAELSESGEMLDGIAAVVNEGVVLKSQLYKDTATIIARAREQKMQLPPENILQEQVLERLILEELQLQRAARIGLQVSDQMLNQAIASVAQQNNIPFERLPEVLAEDGISYADYRRDTRKQLTLDQLRRIEVIGRISVAPREIQQCLDNLEDNVVVNSEYDLAHILVSIPESATGEQIGAAEIEAKDVYRQLLLGADFSEMAIRHSDSQTSLEGGQLGWLKGDQLPTMFYKVVGDLQVGEVSEPIRTVSGFHIVRVNNSRGTDQRSEIEQVSVRHILITPNEIIDDQTAKQRLDDARSQITEGADFGELAKLISDDPGSANNGGEMGWTGPGTFVPEFEQVANTAEIGVVSEPFRSRFGWHILEVLDRRTYDNTEDLKEETCDLQIRNSKLANESEIWQRRIRDEAYVEIRM
ncbi:MAG: peptidylprolyl isomerase [Gammaproteobacteria bacterium]|nr:peptidylprolyl isomerase [Gammaproteobacteria bacterium]MDH4315744.1 peptidylprolyl isomerase [Gammaproteobacteria bacterium]MDH5214150.1 peptidylprolyl isomerase [Gammaproteobacteria bacterium]MDH5501331.1 peptidylprolyl isomerase [Gammaproteobacteria bacterium]